jgi:lipid A 3-O-deacylase
MNVVRSMDFRRYSAEPSSSLRSPLLLHQAPRLSSTLRSCFKEVAAIFALALALCAPSVATELQDTRISNAGLTRPLSAERFDVRFGVFGHSVGGREKSSAVNLEIVSPRIASTGSALWDTLMPRVHLGALANLSGATNLLYAGPTWTIPVNDKISVEVFGGGALHDGEKGRNSPKRAALGCDGLYSIGASAIYRIDADWSIVATYHHFSNGRVVFKTRCGGGAMPNHGLNQYGIRIGRSF